MKHVAVFASGNGTNFEAIASASYQDIKIELLICDNKNAHVLERAKRYDVCVYLMNPKDYESKSEYETKIVELLKLHHIDLICLAGYMRYVGSILLLAYADRIINIHPSLLPAFKGKHSILDAYKAKATTTGVTIHYVNQEIDGGKIIAQESIPIGHQSLESLEEQIHQIEHRLFPRVIQQILGEEK